MVTIDGCNLDAGLNPAQDAFVKYRGTQCEVCTNIPERLRGAPRVACSRARRSPSGIHRGQLLLLHEIQYVPTELSKLDLIPELLHVTLKTRSAPVSLRAIRVIR